MFGTYEKFNFIRATFARKGSAQFIVEDFYKPGMLRFSGNRGGDMITATDFAFDIKLTVNGVPVPYTYFADESVLRIEAVNQCCATVEFALTERGHTRVRGINAGLRLELRSATGGGARACRGAFALPDESGWEADFGRNGKLFFKALEGSFHANTSYDNAKNAYATVIFDFLPDAATGEFDAAIHEYLGKKIAPFGEYEEFDEIVADNAADFAEFSEIYKPAAKGYEEITKYARWTVWSHRSGTTDALVEPVIFFQNSSLTVAASWQQSYNAMAMVNGPEEAWRQIRTMFNYQQPNGRIPGMIGYTGGTTGMQPPFQGFALDFVVRKAGEDFLTPESCEEMYPKFAAWTNYWTTHRNAGIGGDVTHIFSPHESGWDDASNFQDGFPAIDPNNLAFIVLMCESCARLARICGKDAESKDWLARAEKLTKYIIDETWDGEKFATIVKGKKVDAMSLACYQPIMLGARLPQNIIDKVAEKLVIDGELLTEIGLASESMKSKFVTFGTSFVCGRVVGPQNMILTVGLQAAGKQKEADYIARRFCDQVKREGPILGYAPYDYYPLTGEKADEQKLPTMMDGGPWSSWTANSFLTMVGNIVGK